MAAFTESSTERGTDQDVTHSLGEWKGRGMEGKGIRESHLFVLGCSPNPNRPVSDARGPRRLGLGGEA